MPAHARLRARTASAHLQRTAAAPAPHACGIASTNLAGANCDAGGLSPPNAIIRLERIRDNNWATCPTPLSANAASTDFWPNVLYDTRESIQRDTAPATLMLNGAMYYVGVDASEICRSGSWSA